jgi:acetoin utilization protein AcuC
MMRGKAAFVYSSDCLKYDFGPGHVFRPERALHTFNLLKAVQTVDRRIDFFEPKPAEKDEMLLFHTRTYVEALLEENEAELLNHGIGFGDNPYFEGIGEAVKIVAGASITAAELLLEGYETAFSYAGGLHHAHPDYAYGFCLVNDIALALKKIIVSGVEQKGSILYVDVDAHFGDGVVYGFYNSDVVVTFSIHESGRYLFPGTGFSNETGKDKGEGLKINVPLPPYSSEREFLTVLDEVLFPLIEIVSPRVIALQLGTDGYREDPLTHLKYSPYCYIYLLEELLRLRKKIDFKLLVFGGGGYVPWFASLIWFLFASVITSIFSPFEALEFALENREMLPGMPKSVRFEPSGGKITPEYEEEFEIVLESSLAILENIRRNF